MSALRLTISMRSLQAMHSIVRFTQLTREYQSPTHSISIHHHNFHVFLRSGFLPFLTALLHGGFEYSTFSPSIHTHSAFHFTEFNTQSDPGTLMYTSFHPSTYCFGLHQLVQYLHLYFSPLAQFLPHSSMSTQSEPITCRSSGPDGWFEPPSIRPEPPLLIGAGRELSPPSSPPCCRSYSQSCSLPVIASLLSLRFFGSYPTGALSPGPRLSLQWAHSPASHRTPQKGRYPVVSPDTRQLHCTRISTGHGLRTSCLKTWVLT